MMASLNRHGIDWWYMMTSEKLRIKSAGRLSKYIEKEAGSWSWTRLGLFLTHALLVLAFSRNSIGYGSVVVHGISASLPALKLLDGYLVAFTTNANSSGVPESVTNEPTSELWKSVR
jgi:hypothetical protein